MKLNDGDRIVCVFMTSQEQWRAFFFSCHLQCLGLNDIMHNVTTVELTQTLAFGCQIQSTLNFLFLMQWSHFKHIKVDHFVDAKLWSKFMQFCKYAINNLKEQRLFEYNHFLLFDLNKKYLWKFNFINWARGN